MKSFPVKFTFYLCALLLLTSWFAQPRRVAAQAPTPTADEVNLVAKQLYCPVCESTPLDVCPTEACRQWRDLIGEMLADGKSEAEIKQYFVEHYGPQVLNEPPNRGVAYLVPALILALGAFVLWRGFQSWKKPQLIQDPVAEDTPPEDPYVAQLEEELRKRS